MIVFSARTSLVLTLITVVLGVCVYLVGIQQDIRQKELARITAEFSPPKTASWCCNQTGLTCHVLIAFCIYPSDFWT